MRWLSWLLVLALLLSGCAALPAETTAPTETAQTPTQPTELSEPSVPETTAPPSALEQYLDSMTLEQKVGQLFIVAPEALSGGKTVTAWSDDLTGALERYPVGGIILFGSNIQTPDQLTALNTAMQAASATPLFLCIDEEGGLVARLGNKAAFGLTRYKNAASVGASGDPTDAWAMGKTIGKYLRQYGFNLNFAPVADVNTNPDNPVIGSRAFSSDAATAAELVQAFADGLNCQGVLATYKHFPGHGDTAEDSHHATAVSYKTAGEMRECEWLPFARADGNDLVMVGHISVPAITGDMTPATLSDQVVTGILRQELGFTGLIVTDSLSMAAVTDLYSPGEAALAAFEAGCDLLLMPESLPEAFDAMVDAVRSGRVSEDTLDATVLRILSCKQSLGLLNPAQ